MKIYISGKISGMDINESKKLFKEAGLKLKKQYPDCVTVNPHELPDNHDKSWESYMKECIKALCDCTHILPLDNWIESRGAKIEVLMASTLNLTVMLEKRGNIHIASASTLELAKKFMYSQNNYFSH